MYSTFNICILTYFINFFLIFCKHFHEFWSHRYIDISNIFINFNTSMFNIHMLHNVNINTKYKKSYVYIFKKTSFSAN